MRRERGAAARDLVFRPGHNLPTMSLDEFGRQELARAQAQQARDGSAEARAAERAKRRTEQLERDGDEDDEAAHEAATLRSRAWDEFCDANPKGWGNRPGNM